MSGFWIAPRRASAAITTIVSSVVGSCHETIVPGADAVRRRDRRRRAAAVSCSWRPVSERPWSSASSTWSDHCSAACSTSAQTVGGYGGIPSHAALTVTCLSGSASGALASSSTVKEPHVKRGHDLISRTAPRVSARARHGSAPPGTGAPIRSTSCATPRGRDPASGGGRRAGSFADLRRARRRASTARSPRCGAQGVGAGDAVLRARRQRHRLGRRHPRGAAARRAGDGRADERRGRAGARHRRSDRAVGRARARRRCSRPTATGRERALAP